MITLPSLQFTQAKNITQETRSIGIVQFLLHKHVYHKQINSISHSVFPTWVLLHCFQNTAREKPVAAAPKCREDPTSWQVENLCILPPERKALMVTLSSSLRAMVSSFIPNKRWARGRGGRGREIQTFSNGAHKSHSHQKGESPYRLLVAWPTLPLRPQFCTRTQCPHTVR